MLSSAHSGSDDVVFGKTMTGRDIPVDGIIDMLGPTLATVRTRIKIDKSLSVRDYLHRVHERATEVLPFQHVGLGHIRRLGTETAMACDFQNLLVIQTATEDSGKSKIWDPVNTGVSDGFFTYPLVVESNTEGSCIHADVHYNDNVISAWHVQRLLYQMEFILGHFYSALGGIDSSMNEVKLIVTQDASAIQEWNNYRVSPVEECIHGVFQRQADLTPQNQAVWLSPFQRLYFQMTAGSMDLTRDGRFNQSQLLRLGRPVEFTAIRNAIRVIVQQHSMLRARFSKDEDGTWKQRLSPFVADSGFIPLPRTSS